MAVLLADLAAHALSEQHVRIVAARARCGDAPARDPQEGVIT
jgi:hypothetical protein